MENGYVYCVSNEGMKGFVKIGYTMDIKTRLQSLDTTNVPYPFECVCVKKVNNPRLVETRLHKRFDEYRCRKNREFFSVSVTEVKAAFDDIQGDYTNETVIRPARAKTPLDDISNDPNDDEVKENLIKHLRTKTPCQCTLHDEPRENLLAKLTSREFVTSYNCPKCNTEFGHASSMYRHKARCRGTTEKELLKRLQKNDDKIKELRDLVQAFLNPKI